MQRGGSPSPTHRPAGSTLQVTFYRPTARTRRRQTVEIGCCYWQAHTKATRTHRRCRRTVCRPIFLADQRGYFRALRWFRSCFLLGRGALMARDDCEDARHGVVCQLRSLVLNFVEDVRCHQGVCSAPDVVRDLVRQVVPERYNDKKERFDGDHRFPVHLCRPTQGYRTAWWRFCESGITASYSDRSTLTTVAVRCERGDAWP